jgi:CubicO group peptidase (beta-lactamase class C family)
VIVSDKLQQVIGEALASGEIGLQVAAYLDGELIVDECAGTTALGSTVPVDSSTLFPVFSVTKGVTVTALHLQAERGLVDYEAPIADYWPEYAAAGKARTTVADLLTHRSGLFQMPDGVTTELMCDWDWMIDHLAAEAPVFEPGTTTAYHSINWGWQVGEIVRRVDGLRRSFAQFVTDEVLGPLGISDVYLKLPESEIPRVAALTSEIPETPPNRLGSLAAPPAAAPIPEIFGRPDVWMSEIPGANGLMTARGVARMYAMLACGGELDGVRLLSTDRVEWCAQPRPNPYQPDIVSNTVRWIGRGGYWVGGSPHAEPIIGSSPRVVHHPGAGGSIAWADLDHRLAVAITHNRMFGVDVQRLPLMSIADAVREVAGIR